MSISSVQAAATTVAADPYPWPYAGALDVARTALLMIDWQTDFCGPRVATSTRWATTSR